MTISKDILSVGVNDPDTGLFEGQYRVPSGMAYNSYVILDERIAVLDTVDEKLTGEWRENLRHALGARVPDYLIVQHMEPDHSAGIVALTEDYPSLTIVATTEAFAMMERFFGTDFRDRRVVVSDGDRLPLGKHTLTFVTAPMVHWPEVVMTYDERDGVLFSADAFGKFGTSDASGPWRDEARRYYIGVVGKYGDAVTAVLDKLSAFDLRTICPLHGPILRGNLEDYLSLYRTWASYRPEAEGVVIAYTSVYGHTRAAVKRLYALLQERSCENVVLHDLARCDMAEAVSDAFRYSHLVLATTTYNAGIFPFMREFIAHLRDRGFKRRSVAFIENGSWAPSAGRIMREMMETCEDMHFLRTSVHIRSALSEENERALVALADELCAPPTATDGGIDDKALLAIGYGLYVVTSFDGKKDNGLVVNTVTQVTNTPNRIAVTIGKTAYSHGVILSSGKMNVNCLSADAPFALFQRFGFASGRDTDKMQGVDVSRTENGLAVLKNDCIAVISLSVERYVDLDTHGMFICTVDEAHALCGGETMTYEHYLRAVKPKPQSKEGNGYVCRVCGYVYEGKTLPEDFVCPICRHGKADFEPL